MLEKGLQNVKEISGDSWKCQGISDETDEMMIIER